MLSTRAIVPAVILATVIVVRLAPGQVTFEEAQRRLNAKLATKPASTQPLSDVDRLRAENRRLREENAAMQTEISQLRDALAKSSTPTTQPGDAATSRPGVAGAKGSPDLRARLAGRWQGGDLLAGTAFVTEFNDDGTYRQSWLASTHTETGHWDFVADDVIQMWTGNGAPKHPNQWRVTATEAQLTLTPVTQDGTDTPRARPLVLKRAA